jgi:hypothetical protein
MVTSETFRNIKVTKKIKDFFCLITW